MRGNPGRRNDVFTGSNEGLTLNKKSLPTHAPIYKQAPGVGKRRERYGVSTTLDGGLPSSHMGTVGAESVMQSFPGHQYRSHTQSGGTLGRRQEVLGLAIAAIADMPIVLRPHGVARRCVSTHAVVDVISVVSAEQVERLPSQEFEHCAPFEQLHANA